MTMALAIIGLGMLSVPTFGDNGGNHAVERPEATTGPSKVSRF